MGWISRSSCLSREADVLAAQRSNGSRHSTESDLLMSKDRIWRLLRFYELGYTVLTEYFSWRLIGIDHPTPRLISSQLCRSAWLLWNILMSTMLYIAAPNMTTRQGFCQASPYQKNTNLAYYFQIMPRQLHFRNIFIIIVMPIISISLALRTPLRRETGILAFLYHVQAGLGITAG